MKTPTACNPFVIFITAAILLGVALSRVLAIRFASNAGACNRPLRYLAFSTSAPQDPSLPAKSSSMAKKSKKSAPPSRAPRAP